MSRVKVRRLLPASKSAESVLKLVKHLVDDENITEQVKLFATLVEHADEANWTDVGVGVYEDDTYYICKDSTETVYLTFKII